MVVASLAQLEQAPPNPLRLGKALHEAQSVEEMDAATNEIERQTLAFADQLMQTLRTPSSNEVRVRACYLLAFLGVERAAETLATYVDVDSGVVGDFDKIRRWRRHPCLEALMAIGRGRAVQSLVELLKRGEKEDLTGEVLRALYWMQGDAALESLDQAFLDASSEEAARLRKAREALQRLAPGNARGGGATD